MKAALEKELAALSLEEKVEVIDFLIPAVHGAGELSPELEAELERRIQEDENDPSGSVSLDEFRSWVAKRS